MFDGSAATARVIPAPRPHLAREPGFDPAQQVAEQARRPPFVGAVKLNAIATRPWRYRPTAIACVPARDEAETLARCLGALRESLAALDRSRCAILVVANNCADETFRIAAAASAADGVPILACDATFSDPIADIGHVRRFALDCGAALADPDAILLSTDADTDVAPQWASALASTLAQGAAMAYGPVLCPDTIASLDPRSAATARLEQSLAAAQAALWAAIVPGRPQVLGLAPGSASMAVRACAYDAVGGLPALPSSEDRALADRFIESGETVAYAATAAVRTSTRLSGRARGGMADTLSARRHGHIVCDGAFLPTMRFAWLALAYRLLAGEGDSAHALLLAQKLEVPVSLLLPSTRPLGRRWAALRRAMPPVRPMTAEEAKVELGTAARLNKVLSAQTGLGMRDIETRILAIGRCDA